MPSPDNVNTLEKSAKMLKDARGFYFTDFTGMTVHTLESLRRELKKNRGDYLVIKNTLGSIAFRQLGLEETNIKNIFVGSTGIAIAYDDAVVLAKVLKETQNLKIKGGFIQGFFYDSQAVLRLAQIPSRSILISELLGSINIVGNLVGILQGITRNLVYTLEGIKSKGAK